MACSKCCGGSSDSDLNIPTTSGAFPRRRNEEAPEELLTLIIGSCGRWRWMAFSILSIFMIFYGVNLYASDLLLPHDIQFKCIDGKLRFNANHNYTCYTENGEKCRSFRYSHKYGISITEKWNLVCLYKNETVLCVILFRSGLAVGYLVFGILSDKCGRIRILYASLLLQVLMGIMTASSNSFIAFIIINGLYGVTLSGTALMAFVLGCEIASNKWRTFDLGILYVFATVGCCLLPYSWIAFENGVRNILLISLPQTVLILFLLIMRESPLWLLSKNQPSETQQVFFAIAALNGTMLPSNFHLRPVKILRRESDDSLLFSTCRSVTLSWSVSALYIVWILCYFMGSNVLWKIKFFSMDTFTSILFVGVSNVGGAVIGLILCHIFQHRIVIALSSIFGCAGVILSYKMIQELYEDRLICYAFILSYGLYSISYFTLWNATPRMFPTEFRGRGLGVALCFSQISFIAARLLFNGIYLSDETILPVFIGSTAIVLICCGLLYCVHKRELPDLLEDSLKFTSMYKPIRWKELLPTRSTFEETEVILVDYERGTQETSTNLHKHLPQNRGTPPKNMAKAQPVSAPRR